MNEKIEELRMLIKSKYLSAIPDGVLCIAFTWLAFDAESILWTVALFGGALFFLYDAWTCLKDIERYRNEIKTVKAREAHRRMLGRG